MKKTCFVCGEEYTESQWRKTKGGGYRAFRHFDFGGVRWCKAPEGKHLTMMVNLGRPAPKSKATGEKR